MRTESHILVEDFCSSFDKLLVDCGVKYLKVADSRKLVFLHISILEVGLHDILISNELFEGSNDHTCGVVQITLFDNKGQAIPLLDLFLETTPYDAMIGVDISRLNVLGA